MAERAQEADIAAVKRTDILLFAYKMCSLVFAFVIVMLVLGSGLALLFFDKDIAGFAVLIGGTASFVAAWHYGRNQGAQTAESAEPADLVS